MGALLVIVPAALLHSEIEVSPAGRPGTRTHTGVHARPMRGELLAVGLFPSLAAGSWTLLSAGSCGARSIEVVDGQVTQVDWR
jgi:hypothetical protein